MFKKINYLQVIKADIVIPNLSPTLNNYSIALLTDVHIGPTVTSKRVEQIVEITNNLKTDSIAIVGDLIDGFIENLESRTRPLVNLKAPIYFATGLWALLLMNNQEAINGFKTIVFG